MNVETIVQIASEYYKNNSLDSNKAIEVIMDYCIDSGKDTRETNNFINTIINFPIIIGDYFKQALDYYLVKFNIIILSDKNNKILKVYQNEEINNSTNAGSEEYCQECKSIDDSEGTSYIQD